MEFIRKKKPVAEQMVISEQKGITVMQFPKLNIYSDINHFMTTRIGGVSKGIYSQMNLSYTRGDKKEDVDRNFQLVANALQVKNCDIVYADQTHTDHIRIVHKCDAGCGVTREREYHDIDGLITNERGIVLFTSHADCVPLFFYDPVKKAIGMAHAGWKGTLSGIGGKMAILMHDTYGSNVEDIIACIGPSICVDCYEVSSDVAEPFINTYGQTVCRAGKKEGKYQLDLWKANELNLLNAGILKENLFITDICTCCNHEKLHSHRASHGKRGNLGAFIMLK